MVGCTIYSMVSSLQKVPKSKILESGYINIYSKLNYNEKRQLQYKTRYKTDTPKWDDSMVYLAKYFHQNVKPDSVILDAGCGNGNYIIDENRSKISWAVGVDVSQDFVSKNICLDEIIISNLEALPFESNKFDAVISLWVLEHLQNPTKVFAEIVRVLKPGGLFLFATPNSQYLPLKVMHLVKNNSINYFLNKKLFGRAEKEIFPTFYKANTVGELKNNANCGFEVVELRLNSDVSYTSFNGLSYFMSKLVLRLPKMVSRYTHPHIIGVWKK